MQGTGEPVLLIHVGLCVASFAPVMDEPALGRVPAGALPPAGLCGKFCCACPVTTLDQAADVAGLVGCLGLGPMHVVGHSYGGLVALQLALDCPDLVGSLVLMSRR